MHFGLQGCQMCLQFKWGDIELKVDTAGEYLFQRRSTKMRQGTARNNIQLFHLKIFATGSFVTSIFICYLKPQMFELIWQLPQDKNKILPF